jgi:hypothetical protein
MVSNNSDITNSHERELREMLKIGVFLGTGPRYLLYYYGQLAITNNAGLMCWPKGPKAIVAVVTAQECAGGLSSARRVCLLAKLCSFEDIRERQYRQAREDKYLLCLQGS